MPARRRPDETDEPSPGRSAPATDPLRPGRPFWRVVTRDDTGGTIETTNASYYVTRVRGTPGRTEVHADLALMASAQDLLEAAERVVRLYDRSAGADWSAAMRDLVAALEVVRRRRKSRARSDG